MRTLLLTSILDMGLLTQVRPSGLGREPEYHET